SEERVRIDGLTGLATRTAAAEMVDALVDAGNEIIHCAFIDIDDFKHLNDNHGYAAGDQALIAIGELLRSQVPASWTVARFGGDEFVAIGAEHFEFRALIDAEIRLNGHGSLQIAQSLSVGLTAIPAERATAEHLFREAASALRFAKRLGKHQVMEMTDELRALEESKVKLGASADAALDSGDISPWAQRIVDLRNQETVGLELLARWPRSDGSMLFPDDFVPVIEDQGRGPALGMLMIKHAIEALTHPWLRNRSTFITVNLSARHLYHRRLPSEILALLGRHSVLPERLVLEITESQHLPSSPIWQETAHQLRTLGTGLAMDDFGSGYSSMEQLLQVPFTHLKVDRVVTQALDRPGAAEFAASIAAMAEGAGMVSIAEGIETPEQLDAMQAAGYRFGQGYLLHRPEPLAEVIESFAPAKGSTAGRRNDDSGSVQRTGP
ncbi:MAG: bifunctional diguanylate cyclase/phosphodiesterase, partial [bacterium]|nr:bifunctional diguanylate cyclase/phosphodiesterase [bacterium]